VADPEGMSPLAGGLAIEVLVHLTSDKTVKNEGSREKCTPSSLIFVNSPNLVHVCGYKLPITGQNLALKGRPRYC